MPFTITSLRQRPAFSAIIAERCWTEWWVGSEISREDYRRGVDACAAGEGLPAGFVAHAGDEYIGSILLIANDLDARPALLPWLAALWIEPIHRKRGAAADLITAACAEAGRLGYATVYLCATAENTPYYLKRGFAVIEEDVEEMNIFAIPCS